MAVILPQTALPLTRAVVPPAFAPAAPVPIAAASGGVPPWVPMQNTIAAFSNARSDIDRFAGQGQYMRAAGAAVRPLVTAPAAAFHDLVTEPVMAAGPAIGNFLGGLIGSSGSTAVTPAAAPIAPVAAPQAITPAQAVTQSLAKGATAPETITPQARALAAINAVLSKPFTLKEFEGAVGALPAVSGSVPRPQTNADRAVGAASSIADTSYKADLAVASKIEDAEKRSEAVQKATDKYFSRITTVAGRSVQPLTMQDMLNQGQQ